MEVCSMSDLSGELTVTIITSWWLQKLGGQTISKENSSAEVSHENTECQRSKVGER